MGPRHVVVIGSQRSNLLLPRCQSNFKWVLPELWFSPPSWLKQKTVVVLNYKPWHSSPTGISVSWNSKWMVGRIMLRASGGNNMAQHPLCVCVCVFLQAMHVSVQYLYVHLSTYSLSLQLSRCQAAINTWISRSPPRARLLLHSPVISTSLKKGKLHSCLLFLRQCIQLPTVTEHQQCFRI